MRRMVLIAGALTVIVMTAGCAGLFAGNGTNDTGTPLKTASAGTDHPLRGVTFWIPGRLIDANGSAIVLATDGKRIALNTTHAVLFESNGGKQAWGSIGTWANNEMNESVCVSAHIHGEGELHVVKAFYNSTCTPLSR